MKSKTTIVYLLLLVIMLDTGGQVNADQWDDIKSANKIVVGMDTTFPPFQYIENLEAVGYEVDLSMRLGEILGVNIEILTTAWGSIIPDLQAGNFDIIMSAMTITSIRQTQIDFTIPYFFNGLGIFVQFGNPFNINDVMDANSTSVNIGVITGTGADSWVSNNLNNGTKLSYTTDTMLYQAFNDGNVDVIIHSWYSIGTAVEGGVLTGEMPDYGFNANEEFGIGVRKGETQLLQNLNNAITTMFIDGSYSNITRTWFNLDGIANPIVQTTSVLVTTSTDTTTTTSTDTTTTTSTVTETDHTVETSYDISTSTIIESKAEVAYSPVTMGIIFVIGIWSYSIRKRQSRN
ncbi:MAG: amino acid ABC transporter substrate-binding protein [Candidatus Heimdallarchaeota archaeon]|nr:amino acid ABC transporter substrate-binding protein [Candidatus Heimdallarchaeota archaeon]